MPFGAGLVVKSGATAGLKPMPVRMADFETGGGAPGLIRTGDLLLRRHQPTKNQSFSSFALDCSMLPNVRLFAML